MTSVQWKKLVVSEGWLQKLDKVTECRFHDSATAQEASTYVLDKLSEENWARLNSFNGGSQPETYLFAVSNNLIEEFSRRKFGRLRPPEWLKREGDLWVKIWQQHCLERRSRDEILQRFCRNALRFPEQILAIIKTIRSRLPTCGSKQQMLSMEELEGTEQPASLTSPSPEAELTRTLLEERLAVLAELLEKLGGPSNKSRPLERTTVMLDELKNGELLNALDISEEEILILRMVYQEGLKLNVVAMALGMPAYQPGRILKKIFQKCLEYLKQKNIDTEELRDALVEVGA